MIKKIPLKTTASAIFEIFKNERHVFFLDSSQKNAKRGRYSFIGFNPFKVYKASDVDSLKGLRKAFGKYQNSIKRTALTPLPAGIVGFISYDYGVCQERIKRCTPKSSDEMPDSVFGFYDTVLTIDHVKKTLIISSTGLPAKTLSSRQKKAKVIMALILKKLKVSVLSLESHGVIPANPTIKKSFTKTEYLRAVKKALKYIGQGDVYQVNVSQRFEYNVPNQNRNDVAIYKKLREFSPSSFSGYLDTGENILMSSSPEQFLKMTQNKIETRPMKGTRPRGKNKTEDQKYYKELKDSKKEKAELLMITDLLRNDLGRVCKYGSVRVKDMRTIEKYSTVFQATSTVEGLLRKDKDVFDVLEACLPGGSITGCPKIRAMQIIEELEPIRRGIYTGIMGYINFNGDMDFNILIRTILASNKKLQFHVGGGIVADSRPEAEYQETLVKAKAIQDCLRQILSDPVTLRPCDQENSTTSTNPTTLRNSITQVTQRTQQTLTIFLDGKYLKADENLIQSLTPGVIRSPGVFETLTIKNGAVQILQKHLIRFHRGLKLYKIKAPCSDKEIAQTIKKVIDQNKIKNGRLRLAVWKDAKVRIAIVAQKTQLRNSTGYKAVVSSIVRPKTRFTHVKSMDYFVFRQALLEARAEGYDEAILLNSQKQLVEGGTSNIFFVKNKTLFTPAIVSGCLNGITRQLVIDCAKAEKIPVKIGLYSLKNLQNADEAFVTNSLIGVMPLLSLNDRKIGIKPGSFTRRLQDDYQKMIKKFL